MSLWTVNFDLEIVITAPLWLAHACFPCGDFFRCWSCHYFPPLAIVCPPRGPALRTTAILMVFPFTLMVRHFLAPPRLRILASGIVGDASFAVYLYHTSNSSLEGLWHIVGPVCMCGCG